MVVEVAVALCCWCWCSCVGAREKICVRDAFGAQRERRVVSARIIEREKRKGDVVDFYTGNLCLQIRCQENPDDDSIAHKERGGDAPSTRLSSRRRRKRFARFSSQRARDHSSSSSSSFCGVPKAHSFKVSSFFFFSSEESKFRVPCVVVFVVVVGTKTALVAFCFAVKVVLKCLLWEKMRFIMGRRQRWCYPKKKKNYDVV